MVPVSTECVENLEDRIPETLAASTQEPELRFQSRCNRRGLRRQSRGVLWQALWLSPDP